MGKLVVLMHLTLDGVMQAPGRADEDSRNGFHHGGWAAPRGATIDMASLGMGEAGALLFGRRTYEGFFAFWPRQADNPYTGLLNSVQKYIASTTLREPLPWQHSTLLAGDVAEAVAMLKAQVAGNLLIMGSGVLVQSPMPQYLLSIYQPDGGPPPAEVLERVMRELDAVNQELRAAGMWVFTGGLHAPSTATV